MIENKAVLAIHPSSPMFPLNLAGVLGLLNLTNFRSKSHTKIAASRDIIVTYKYHSGPLLTFFFEIVILRILPMRVVCSAGLQLAGVIPKDSLQPYIIETFSLTKTSWKDSNYANSFWLLSTHTIYKLKESITLYSQVTIYVLSGIIWIKETLDLVPRISK
jgi:hypothetical protein